MLYDVCCLLVTHCLLCVVCNVLFVVDVVMLQFDDRSCLLFGLGSLIFDGWCLFRVVLCGGCIVVSCGVVVSWR